MKGSKVRSYKRVKRPTVGSGSRVRRPKRSKRVRRSKRSKRVKRSTWWGKRSKRTKRTKRTKQRGGMEGPNSHLTGAETKEQADARADTNRRGSMGDMGMGGPFSLVPDDLSAAEGGRMVSVASEEAQVREAKRIFTRLGWPKKAIENHAATFDSAEDFREDAYSMGLPENWGAHTSETTGSIYYFNRVTGVSEWERPTEASVAAAEAAAVEAAATAKAATEAEAAGEKPDREWAASSDSSEQADSPPPSPPLSPSPTTAMWTMFADTAAAAAAEPIDPTHAYSPAANYSTGRLTLGQRVTNGWQTGIISRVNEDGTVNVTWTDGVTGAVTQGLNINITDLGAMTDEEDEEEGF